ncbi:CBS domain-containing protein [Vibrio harveyi]|nr:CBS domain-containing protein [Vibrio harveyi]
MMNSWKKAVLSPSQAIKTALEIIDSEALRVALVVADDNRLLGVVTDGDIRRGLLAGKGLDSPVSEVMNSNPITAKASSSREELIELMNKLDILFIPLIDDGKLTGLETLHGALVDKPSYENPVFIMAGALVHD